MPKFEGYFPCATKTKTDHATSAYTQTRSGNAAGDNKNTNNNKSALRKRLIYAVHLLCLVNEN